MPLTMLIEAREDEQSFKRVADNAEKTFGDAGREAGDSFTKNLSPGLRGVEGQFRATGQSAGKEFKNALSGSLDEAFSGITGQFGDVGRTADETFSGISTKAKLGALGVAGIGLAAVVAGKQLYDMGAQWDSIADNITIRTGKIGDQLKALTDVVGDVGSTTAAPLGDIGEIVAQLNQSMPGLADNNTAIRDMASNLAYLDANGQSVNIRELGKAFSAFNTNAADQVKTLDNLAQVSQATGIPINQLIQTVQSGAPQFKQFGLGMGESTALLAAFEEGGLNAEGTLAGLRIALKNLGTDARGPQKALADTIDEIKKLHDAGDEVGAQELAQKVFGTKNFAPFLDAIESGRVNVEGLKKAIDDTGLSIKNMQDLTNDGAQAWQILTNTLKTDLKPVADGVFGAINGNVQLITGHFGEWLDKLTGVDSKLQDASQHMQDLAATPITPDSALGKMLLPGGGLPGMPGYAAPNAAGGALGQTSLLPYSWGTNAISPPGLKSGSGPKLPDAPVLPYDTSLPGAFANLPQTAELVGAENSWMDARHTLAEKQARLTQLEGDNNAKADDIQKAKNDVINARQAQDQAELRLYDTQNKRIKQHAEDMNQLGAQIDSDFGISKGLSGIVENLTKFLGNLIAAPALAQLNAVANAPGQAQGGSGLMGILGAQGAFGPQYTAAGQAAAASTSSSEPKAVLGPNGTVSTPTAARGYPGDAALLSGVPAGSYSLPGSGAWDLTKGLGDCSSAVEDLVNIMDGRPTGGRSMATGNEAEWLQSHGFQPGMGGPGDFRVGFNSGHTQATLPGGTPFNWGSDSAAARGGVGGTGADDPAFTSHYYRPAGGGGGAVTDPQATSPGLYGLANTSPGLTSPTVPGWGGPQGLPPGVSGGGGNSPIWGANPAGPGLGGSAISPLGPGVPRPGAGGAAGAPLGGVEPPSNKGGGQLGMTSGGTLDTALSLASSGLDLLAPGAGQAAQMGIKLANRAIQFGGQAAGIMTQGALDTFLPWGGSELASKNWITRIAGGLAGAAPALPNMAGKATGPMSPDQGQGGQQKGPDGGPVNQGVQIMGDYHQHGTEDQASADLASHQIAQNRGPG